MACPFPSKRTTLGLNILPLFTFLWPEPGHMTIFSCKASWEMRPVKASITMEEGRRGSGGEKEENNSNKQGGTKSNLCHTFYVCQTPCWVLGIEMNKS